MITWLPAVGLAVSILAGLFGCLTLLLKITWQASSIVTRLESVESSVSKMNAHWEASARAIGCIEQLEEGYSKIRDDIMRQDEQIRELRIKFGTSEMNGEAE